MSFKSGFVNLYGYPNAGKSTLLNALVGEKIAITTPKAQTTRRRIKGMYNTDAVQIVFSDTPGVLAPKYLLHHKMMDEIHGAREDGDVSLVVIDARETQARVQALLDNLQLPPPIFLVVNKIDVVDKKQLAVWEDFAATQTFIEAVYFVSARAHKGIDELLSQLTARLPESAALYDSEQLSDQSERFIVGELVREQIFLHCDKEIPYGATVVVQSFQDKGEQAVIFADIVVEREGQRRIVLGKAGAMIKAIGIGARAQIENFLGKKVFLDLSVKVRARWRMDPIFLKKMGYTKG